MSRQKFIWIICLLLLAGCTTKRNSVKWNVTLDEVDKQPYGAYLAYHSLQYYFPKAKVESLTRGSRLNEIADGADTSGGHSLLVLAGLDFYLSDNEWNKLK